MVTKNKTPAEVENVTIVMKKKKSEFGAYLIGWLYLLAPVIILAVVLVVKYFIAASDLPDWFKFALLK